MNDIGIIIANWNGQNLLMECLNGILHQTLLPRTIFVVDNGSSDGSVAAIRERFPYVQVLALPTNTGFSSANNRGIAQILLDNNIRYVLTLNNDVVLEPSFLFAARQCAERHAGKQLGAIQGKLMRMNDRKTFDSTGMLTFIDTSAVNRGHAEIDHAQYEQEEEVFGASASAALYTRTALEQTQLTQGEFFDNTYFAYGEDVDLAWRLRLMGFRSYYTPSAQGFHRHSATGKSHSPFKAFFIHRNQLYTIVKVLPFPFLLLALAFLPFRYILLWTSALRKKGASAELVKKSSHSQAIRITLMSWRDFLKAIPFLLQKRKYIQSRRVVGMGDVFSWLKRFRAHLSTIVYGKGKN